LVRACKLLNSAPALLRLLALLVLPGLAALLACIGHICRMHALPQKRATWHRVHCFSPLVAPQPVQQAATTSP
jgi:hypothetical protein